MQKSTEDLPIKMDAPNAVVRQQTGFGDATEYGEISVEHMQLGAGTDITPLLEGLQDDMCQCPHWGYVMDGALGVRYTDGIEEIEEAEQLFYLPPGHTAWVEEDTEFVLFSPQDEHTAVLEHMAHKMGE